MNMKTRGFPSPPYDGFGFIWKRFKLPTGKDRLSGAGYIHFEAFFDEGTSWIEVKWLVRTNNSDKIINSVFCQEKSRSERIWT